MWEMTQGKSVSSTQSHRSGGTDAPAMQRLTGRVRVGERVLDCRIVVTDIYEDGLRIFCTETIAPGCPVDVVLPDVKPLMLRGVVVERYAPTRRGHIVTQNAFCHRMAVRFSRQSETERSLLKIYLSDLRQNFGGAMTVA